MARHVGRAVVEALEAHGVERVFLVPGESFLPELDGLHDSPITPVVCRHEGGAAFMADAVGRMTGRPGVAMVTRGPGAANAFVGVHVAHQDGVPMVLIVGLVPVTDRERFSFQEFDPRAWFGTEAKHVYVLDDPSHAEQVVADAFHLAVSGRPGPVVVAVPEDIAYAEYTGPRVPPRPAPVTALHPDSLETMLGSVARASRPVLYAGGQGWTRRAGELIAAWAQRAAVPVLHEWRSGDRIPFDSPALVGWLGYGRDDAALALLAETDLILAVGQVPGDVNTDSFSVALETPTWVVSPDPQLWGASTHVVGHLLATPQDLAAALPVTVTTPDRARSRRMEAAHERYLATLQPVPSSSPAAPGTVHMDDVIAALLPLLPDDTVVTFGAGNHCLWAQRFIPTRHYPSQLATRNGTMGYSVPAAVAASLQFPDRFVLTVTGDGDLFMNGQELATAAQYGASFLVIVQDNGQFATIRGHQEAHFPGRTVGTGLQNPDVQAWATALGARGFRIDDGCDPAAVLAEAVGVVTGGGRAVVHVLTDPRDMTPAPTP